MSHAPKPKTVCVYASSSNALDDAYRAAAEQLGALLAQRGHRLIYGAGQVGLMGVVARAVHAHGGHVTGVIPERLRDLELAYEASDELIVTQTMRERKAIMESRADAFIALPGGFGTLEELVEVLVLKQLHYHAKPIAILNTLGAYDGLFAFFHRLRDDQFIKESHFELFHVANEPAAAVDYVEQYLHRPHEPKWFDGKPA